MAHKRKYKINEPVADELTRSIYDDMPASMSPGARALAIEKMQALRKKNRGISETDPAFGRADTYNPDKGRLLESRLSAMTRRRK